MTGAPLIAGTIVARFLATFLGFSAGAAAPVDSGERAEVLLRGGAIDRLVGKQLPATFRVRGDRDAGLGAEDVTLVDARYCGGGKDGGTGRFIGVLRPGGAAGTIPALDPGDCRAKLDEVAKRLSGGSESGPVGVVELAAAWAPSELRVSIGDIAAAGEGGRGLARTLARAKTAGPLATVQTSGLRLATERGSSLSLDIALTFLKAADGVVSTLTVACPGCATTPRARVKNPSVPMVDADVEVGATFRFANRVLALYSGEGPLVLEVDRQQVEIRNVQLGGSDGALTVRGRATSRAVAESAQVQMVATGADLQLAEVRAEGEREDCGGLSGGAAMRCTVRNAARGPAAAALAAAMTSHYRGKLLRTLIAPPRFSFEVDGRPMTLRLTPTRASSTGGSLVVHGRAELD